MTPRKRNKKYIILGIFIFLLLVIVGVFCCFKLFVVKTGNPTDIVENYLNDYNKLNNDIISKIKYDFNDKLSNKQEKKYKEIMKKQYQKMFFSILDEHITDSKAVIKVEVTVLNYNYCYNEAANHIIAYSNKFSTEERQIDYKLNKLDTCSERVTYDLTFNLKKVNNKWSMSGLSYNDLKKINGTY